ncbi:hypothetical protein [Pseudobacteroides cellulosolvens]|uniref:Uncharacterized protein n=1 Tax=Pseudobacteroides cellulosolvens ATCC 35603 = DSM 2933 TaxID=398512 RepID=A0A0L6JMP7_9FIRM|nr:hypothetical protein [Pseudobacteroides cellulosolvens]KNY27044.1 hypothetical protein Bccel_2309 [Pseudobacteroides cellulosolvens ATCC 35603 = DSM 2933]
MDRQILATVLDTLNIKKSFAAKVIGVNNSTFSLKLKNYKMRYRLFDDDIALLIEKVIKENLFIKENDESVKSIRKIAKAKEIADALYHLIQSGYMKYDSNLPALADDNYPEYIISMIWLEQVKNNDMYSLNRDKAKNNRNNMLKANSNPSVTKTAYSHMHQESGHNTMTYDNIFSREIIPETEIDINRLIEDNYILTSIIKRLLSEMASDSFSSYTPLN